MTWHCKQAGKAFRDSIVGTRKLNWKRVTICDAGIEYGMTGGIMGTARKITVEIPRELLEKAQRASGTGVTQTVCTGLQLVAASRTYMLACGNSEARFASRARWQS